MNLPHNSADYPQRSLSQARYRWILTILVLSIVIFRGVVSQQALFQQALAGIEPAQKVKLPIVPTQTGAATHQITPAEYAALIVNSLSTPDKISQMIMIKLIGPTYSTDEIQMIQQYHVGAVIAFGDAIQSPQQVISLTSSLQKDAYLPLFIATDQEGGYAVNRLGPLVGYRPGAPQMGAADSATVAYNDGKQTLQDFLRFGFNFNLAPVVDIQEPGINNPQLIGRLFSGNITVITQMANSYLEGLQSSNTVIGVLKHFPGLGSSATDPHLGLPVVYKSEPELYANEFLPYRNLIALGNVHAIMVTHEMLPEIDAKYPASLSQKIITGLLRNILGFQGLIVTDSLDMSAIAAQYPIDQAALLAAEAGADVLMGPHTPDQVQQIINTFTNALHTGALTMQQIDNADIRIITQKIEMGLIPLPKEQTPNSSPSSTPAPSPTQTPGSLVGNAMLVKNPFEA